jgi:hypothetical protein
LLIWQAKHKKWPKVVVEAKVAEEAKVVENLAVVVTKVLLITKNLRLAILVWHHLKEAFRITHNKWIQQPLNSLHLQ